MKRCAAIWLTAVLCCGLGAQTRTFVQISDPHVGAAAGLAHLQVVLAEVAALAPKPELVVVTGDLTEKGLDAERQRFVQTITEFSAQHGIRVLAAPGNHDARWSAEPQELAAGPGGPFPRFAAVGDLGFLALDSTLPFGQHGHLSRAQLARCAQLIAAHAEVRDWVLALHHPPDEGRFLDDEAGLLEFVSRHPVSLVLTGHGHAHKVWERNGVPHVMAIGVMNPRFGYRHFEIGAEAITGTKVVIGPREAQRVADLRAPRDHADRLRRYREASAQPLAASRPGGFGVHEWCERLLGFEVPRSLCVSGPEACVQELTGTVLSAALACADLAVVATVEGEVHALRAEDLAARWRAEVKGPLWTAPFASGAQIVVADATPSLVVFDRSGKQQAQIALPAAVTAVGAAAADGARVLALGDGQLARFIPGAEAVELCGILPAMTRAAPLQLGEHLVLPAWDRHVHVLDRAGDLVGKALVHNSFYYAAATADPLAVGAQVLLFGHDQRLLWLEPKSAKIVREERLMDVEPAYSGGVLWPPGRVVLGSLDGALTVVDLAAGRLEQRIPTGGPMFDSTPLVAHGHAYVGTMRGELVVADLTKGEVVQRIGLGGYVVADPVRVADRIVVGSTRGRVLSLRAK